ncbi:RNA polymerase sigma-70 factor [uncultured Aquimarina sp.]|uniref:RNA polymerase sigma-70 factor n=1 Tax=uncultured Aquimarina sp. TaxID=575652 RepID=UPI00262B809B|nr:RNA polymerase sigma-70 factor [uncultured Aquimarina sp.]
MTSGNTKFFESVFKEYFKPLTLYASSYVNDVDIAKDITQDVFIKLYEKRQILQIHTSLKSYLYTSVRNRCLDHIKLHKIRELHKIQIYNSISENVEEESTEVMQSELQAKINVAIASLPDRNREIFRLNRIDGLTNQEIADELNLSKRTVETHISNALKKIKEMILLLISVFSIFF